VTCSSPLVPLPSPPHRRYQVSLRAWAHLPLAGLRGGNHRLVMHPKPVVRGPNAARADVFCGFVLCLHVSGASCWPGLGPASGGEFGTEFPRKAECA
jgi:hypothetical protein